MLGLGVNGVGLINRLYGVGGVGGGLTGFYQPLQYATNTRSGVRKTERPGYDYEVNANTPDVWLEGGLWKGSSMTGATNLATTVMSDWSRGWGSGGSVTVPVDLGDGIFETTFNSGTGWGSVLQFITSSLTAQGFSGFEYRITTNSIGGSIMSVKFAGGNPAGQPDAINGWTADGNWHEIKAYPISGRSRMEIQCRGPNEGGVANESVTIQFRNLRFVDNPYYVSPFANYTIAGESYGTDILTNAVVPWTAAGEIACGLDPKFINGIGNVRPNSGARLWSSASLQMRLDGSIDDGWFLDGDVNGPFDSVMADGQTQYMYGNWDGVNTYGEANPGTNVTTADTAVGSGNLILGNLGSGTRPMHGVFSCLVFDHKLTPSERSQFEALH